MRRPGVGGRLAGAIAEAKHLAFFLLSVGVLVGVIFFHLSVRERVIQLGYTLSRENSRGRMLVRQRAELELERALMKNPEEIGELAEERFGMHIPDKDQLIRIRKTRGKR